MRQAILREDMSCVNWGNRSSKDFPCGYPVPMLPARSGKGKVLRVFSSGRTLPRNHGSVGTAYEAIIREIVCELQESYDPISA